MKNLILLIFVLVFMVGCSEEDSSIGYDYFVELAGLEARMGLFIDNPKLVLIVMP